MSNQGPILYNPTLYNPRTVINSKEDETERKALEFGVDISIGDQVFQADVERVYQLVGTNVSDNRNWVDVLSIPLVYAGFFSQDGVSAPNVDIVYNSFGDVVWEYVFPGVYAGLLDQAFVGGRVNEHFGLMKGDFTQSYEVARVSDGGCTVTTRRSGALVDDLLDNTFIEIKVFRQ